MNMRNLLRKMGQKSFRPGNAAAMLFLNATNPETIKLLRSGDGRRRLQGAAHRQQPAARPGANAQTAAPPATRGHARRSRSR